MLYSARKVVIIFLVATRKPVSAEHRAIREWILRNRGVLQRIADGVTPPVSHQFVQQLAYNKASVKVRSDHPIFRELKSAGWPGVK